jgi:two-component system, cell cycle sensor histidine kinase PleC
MKPWYDILAHADPRQPAAPVRISVDTSVPELAALLAALPPETPLIACTATGQDLGPIDPIKIASALARDLTATRAERDSARRALADADHDRSMFFANFSHELRTPLNAVLGYSDFLLSEVGTKLSADKQRDHLQSIHDASLHMLDLVNAVLDMARLRAHSLELRAEETDISGLIDQVVRLAKPSAQERMMRISVRRRGALPRVDVDPRMLRQILLNLVSNAVKYGAAASTVQLSTHVTARNELRLEVRDHGPGIPADAMAQVLQPFERLSADALGDAVKGTGLGLAVVKALTELHDGRFQLVSVPGEGTRAVVTLPASRVRQAPRPGQQGEFAFTRLVQA